LLLPVAVLGVFALGFLGTPEDSAWLNSSPLWGPGDPFYENAGDRFVANPILIWRGRPSYSGTTAYQRGGVENAFSHNRLGFRDDEPKADAALQVLNIGDSATWGLNLARQNQTYSAQLEQLLQDQGTRAVEVFNAGTIGYSSLQGVRFLQYHAESLGADVVTVYLGNNDPAAGGMKDADRSPELLAGLRAALSRNVFYLLLQKACLSLRAQEATQRSQDLEQQMSEGMGTIFQSREVFYDKLARVTPDQYETNLRTMVELVRDRGQRVVLLKVPMNLLWPPVTRPRLGNAFASGYWCPLYVKRGYIARSLRGEQDPESFLGHPYLSRVTLADVRSHFQNKPQPLERQILDMERAVASGSFGSAAVKICHNLGIVRLLQGRVEQAVALLRRAAGFAAQPGQSPLPSLRARVHYSLGVALLEQGQRDEALGELLRVRKLWPFGMSPDYEQRFTRVVKELQVEWIDLPAEFAAADPQFGGSSLILDWVHPDARGNRVIAEALARLLSD
jgi:lysophospholipase L1-like esterase